MRHLNHQPIGDTLKDKQIIKEQYSKILMHRKYIFFLIARYLVALTLGLGNLHIIYFIFTPLTIYPVFFLLKIAADAQIIHGTNLIMLSNATIELVPACIAGAAYYLFLILNLTTPMRFAQRIKSLAFLLGSFLLLNIARIFLFALFIDSIYFDFTHKAVWYFGSTILVILVWFIHITIFSIKAIPFYSDSRWLWSRTKKESKQWR